MSIKEAARRAYLQAQKEEHDAKVQDLVNLVKERLNLNTTPYINGDAVAVQGEGFFFFLDPASLLMSIVYGPTYATSITLGVMGMEELNLETLGHLLVKEGIE